MVVYADILIILNFAVDYFLLRITDVLLKSGAKLYRMILASLLGGVLSLYIFLPPLGAVFESGIKILMSIFLTFVCFGFKSAAKFIRTAAVFTLITFAYGGITLAVWYLFHPNGMVINNSVTYFNISPVLLIISATVFYAVSLLIKAFFGKKNATAEECEITLCLAKKQINLTAVSDTGNNLSDAFSGAAVIIIDKKTAAALSSDREVLKTRCRPVPCKTVSGDTLLEGYRLDKAKITAGGKEIWLKSPVAAVSRTAIGENKAIINPEVLS